MRLMIECWRTGQLIPARIETDLHSFEVVRRDGEDIVHIAGAITDSPKDDVRIHEFIAEAVAH